MIELLAFFAIPLAVWRLSNMLADTEQSGPLALLDWIRLHAGVKFDEHSMPYAENGSFGQMLICVYCNSIWIGILFTIGLIINIQVTTIVSLPFALSAIAIFVQEIINGKTR